MGKYKLDKEEPLIEMAHTTQLAMQEAHNKAKELQDEESMKFFSFRREGEVLMKSFTSPNYESAIKVLRDMVDKVNEYLESK